MKQKPQVLEKKTIAKTQIFEIEALKLQFFNGEKRSYERLLGRSVRAVMMVPLLDAETLLLVREYGAGVDDYVLGFPKGAAEKDEDWVVTANRELQEEVGYGAKQWDLLGEFSVSPGYMTAKMYVCLAQDLYESQLVGDEPEPLELVPWKISQTDALLTHPEFHEARSIAALGLLDYYRRSNG